MNFKSEMITGKIGGIGEETPWFLVLAALLLAYGIYRCRHDRQSLSNRLEIERARHKEREAELSRQLAEAEITALRARMNPHFIFNCLNSVQYYTTRNEPDTVSEYLSKFSRLILLVLEDSSSGKVSLARELEALKLYMEMEAMRFQDKVKYRIEVAPEVDTDTIEIPSLLIQPFAENAVWHGLMHKQEGGMIEVKASLPVADLLRLTITDDGVGREKAAGLKSGSAAGRKSFGIKATEDRIALMNRIFPDKKAKIEVADLVNESGHPSGTRVTLEIQI